MELLVPVPATTKYFLVVQTEGRRLGRTILDHRDKLTGTRELAEKRKTQDLDWMAFLLDEGLRQWFYTSPHVREALPRLRKDVEEKKTSPTAAADSLFFFFFHDRKGK